MVRFWQGITEVKMVQYWQGITEVQMVQYWQGITEVLAKKPVPVPLCPVQVSHAQAWD